MEIDVRRDVNADGTTVTITVHGKSLLHDRLHALECIRQTTGATYCQNPRQFFQELPHHDVGIYFMDHEYPLPLESWKREDSAEMICHVLHRRITAVRDWVRNKKHDMGFFTERASLRVCMSDGSEVRHLPPSVIVL